MKDKKHKETNRQLSDDFKVVIAANAIAVCLPCYQDLISSEKEINGKLETNSETPYIKS